MFLIILTFLSAISISVIAAGYSIIGLATLFAGAVVPIIAMGTALEVGKLVAASWLYHNWQSDVPRLLKTYLFTAIIVLVFITSMGIFGFLSKAHLDQVKPTSGNNIKLEQITDQISRQQTIIDRSQNTLTLLDKALEVYIDKEYVTRGLKERAKQEEERTALNNAIEDASNKIAELSDKKATLSLAQDKIEAEVGPIKYVAELIYGESAKDNIDKAVRIVILILIFVFDPLAVLLLIAANISLRQWRLKKQLTKSNKQQNLQQKLNRLMKRNKNLKKYKNVVKDLGDNPDEIKLKLSQIVNLDDKN
jgi:hypothetical protein|tara:strand:- start:479 stop:1399 length:921 start_codon:yes stop_codon:yes gene_type:complete